MPSYLRRIPGHLQNQTSSVWRALHNIRRRYIRRSVGGIHNNTTTRCLGERARTIVLSGHGTDYPHNGDNTNNVIVKYCIRENCLILTLNRVLFYDVCLRSGFSRFNHYSCACLLHLFRWSCHRA